MSITSGEAIKDDRDESNKTRLAGQRNNLSKCKGTIRDHKVLVFLTGFIIVAVVIGITIGLTLGATIKPKVVYENEFNDEYRLPRTVIPSHYVLQVQPYLIPDDFRFNGSVKILVKCVEKTNTVVFHSKDLSFNAGDIRIQRIRDESSLVINKITFNETNDFVTLHFLEYLKIGDDYLIVINYNGTMSTKKPKGLYISNYVDDAGVSHYIASTQFQTLYARQAFPCFDEPALKATFDIVIVRWRSMTSLSNMPKIRTESRGEDWEADVYNTTMKMSTYLVAFVIGKYVGKADGKIAVWTPVGIHESSDYALSISLKILQYYENLFGIQYEAPKLDMVAVTRHSANAMENWGLITYQKDFLLLEPNADEETTELVFIVVAHEIAHQWFGNLVTLKWWSDVWLNEGLTKYMEYTAVRNLNPSPNKIDAILHMVSTDIFEMDCMELHNSLSTVWKNITDKESLMPHKSIDTFVYDKGASIVQMVHRILGDELFWKFIRTYLKENAYGNVEESDFWRYANQALPKTRNVNVDMAKLASWTHQPGFAIVSVERDYSKNTATLTQQSCLTDDKIHSSDLWYIPISYKTKSNIDLNLPATTTTWSSEKSEILYNMPSQDDWILVNDITIASIIVNYDAKNWKLLAAQLRKNHTVFTLEQRYKILMDAFQLARLKYSNADVNLLLDLSAYLHNESMLIMFHTTFTAVIWNNLPLMKLNPLSKEWKEYVIHVLGPLYDIAEKNNTIVFNITHIDFEELKFWMCDLRYDPCIKNALGIFKMWKTERENGTALKRFEPSDILCIAASESNNNSQYLYDLYTKTKHSSIRDALLCSSNSSIITRILDVFRKNKTNEFFVSMFNLADNEKHWTMLFDYIDEQFEEYINNPTTSSKMADFPQMFDSTLVHLEKSLEIAKKHLPNLSGNIESQIRKSIEQCERKIPKMKSEASIIENWLRERPWTK